MSPHGHAVGVLPGHRDGTWDTLRAAVPSAVARHGIEQVGLEQIAEVACVGMRRARDRVGGDDALGLIGSAYLASAGGLQRGFQRAGLDAPNAREGLRHAVGWLLNTLADDPARAAFCYVEIVRGARPLVTLREQIRRGSVGFWSSQHQRSVPGQGLPLEHFELVNSATISLIVTRTAQGRTDELRDLPDAVMALVEPGEGPIPKLSVVRC